MDDLNQPPTSSSSQARSQPLNADAYWVGLHEEQWDALCDEFAPELARTASSAATE